MPFRHPARARRTSPARRTGRTGRASGACCRPRAIRVRPSCCAIDARRERRDVEVVLHVDGQRVRHVRDTRCESMQDSADPRYVCRARHARQELLAVHVRGLRHAEGLENRRRDIHDRNRLLPQPRDARRRSTANPRDRGGRCASCESCRTAPRTASIAPSRRRAISRSTTRASVTSQPQNSVLSSSRRTISSARPSKCRSRSRSLGRAAVARPNEHQVELLGHHRLDRDRCHGRLRAKGRKRLEVARPEGALGGVGPCPLAQRGAQHDRRIRIVLQRAADQSVHGLVAVLNRPARLACSRAAARSRRSRAACAPVIVLVVRRAVAEERGETDRRAAVQRRNTSYWTSSSTLARGHDAGSRRSLDQLAARRRVPFQASGRCAS